MSANPLPDGQGLLQKIWDTLEEIPTLAGQATRAENDYDIAYAEAFLKAEGTVEARKSIVAKDAEVSRLWLEKENMANVSKFAQQAAWNVYPKMLSYMQTLAKNERETANTLSGNRG